jgi:hypothetical protein
MTGNERTTTVAILAEHIDDLEQTKQDGDDDRWDDIASDGVEAGRRGELGAVARRRGMYGVSADLRVRDRVGGVRRG